MKGAHHHLVAAGFLEDDAAPQLASASDAL